jgi:membrane protease YdiL (CAAX protease family)
VLSETARASGWIVLCYAAIHLVGAVLARNALGAVAVQALIAELAAGQLAVAWSDPLAPPPSSAVVSRRALTGAAAGAAVALTAVGLAVVGRGATVAAGQFSAAQIAGGLVMAILVAVRDELVLRGMVLRAFTPVLGPLRALLVCGWLAAAARWGTSDASPLEVAGAGALGAALGAVWLFDRGAWMAVSAHAGLAFVTDTLMRGPVFDVRGVRGSHWGGGDGGLEAGGAWVVTALLAAAIATRFAMAKVGAPRAGEAG